MVKGLASIAMSGFFAFTLAKDIHAQEVGKRMPELSHERIISAEWASLNENYGWRISYEIRKEGNYRIFEAYLKCHGEKILFHYFSEKDKAIFMDYLSPSHLDDGKNLNEPDGVIDEEIKNPSYIPPRRIPNCPETS